MAGEDRGLLRVLTCGSVDDGKSTLIGRLLYDSHLLMSDQLESLARESKAAGKTDGALDFALLLDGLAAEREQGITIDVAYRYFSTASRHFIIADTPGHEQYTRNMVTGASTADLAILLVDARKGLLTQTHRHAYLVALMGIRRVVLAVNKMDLVGWDEARFGDISAAFSDFAGRVGLDAVQAIPISARDGVNVATPSAATAWYQGPTLIEHLDAVAIDTGRSRAGSFRMPVQWVNRPDHSFRGFAGQIASGAIAPGAAVRVLPSGRTTSVARIVTAEGDLASASAGQSVTLTLADEVDCARGDVIAAAGDPPESADQFSADIVWMTEAPLLPGRSYWMKLGTRTVSASVTEIKHRVQVDTLEHLAAKTLELNEIGACNLSLDQPVPFEPYEINHDLGGFILIDRLTNATVGAGMIRFALRRAANIHWQAIDVSKASRAAAKGQVPRVLWFTGLSGAGKSTIANLLEKRLHALGRHTFLLDGDNVRHGLNRDLGFTDADRVENIRRVVEVAGLMAEAGLIVLVSFISPFRAERLLARERLADGEFVEIHVDVPLAEAERRDVKGLYKKARAGQLKNFTGIDSPYEAPEQAEIVLDTAVLTPEQAVDAVMAWLDRSA